MSHQESESLDKVRQLFDHSPYPKIPLEASPKNNYELLYVHNLLTAYYRRNQQVTEPTGKLILDAGCGSGYKSLILAEANPGAKIVGIDLSEESVKLARKRLQYHGFDNAEFYALSIEELPQLELQFDYINADEVLYLLPDLVVGLQAMKSVLKPKGIIRGNLHSSLGRNIIYQAQAVFKMLGLMDNTPRETEIEIVRKFISNLSDRALLKKGWNPEVAKDDEWILCNYLLLGDRGYTIPEMFVALEAADLEFISMVNWQHWELQNLFKEPDNLPLFIAMSLPNASVEEQLHLFELFHPAHRLFDFWCGHPNQAESISPLADWTLSDWRGTQVRWHPQLKTGRAQGDLTDCIARQVPFEVSRYVPLPTTAPFWIESTMAACLLPLWEGTQSVQSLVDRWLRLQPLHPVSWEPMSEERAFEEVKELLMGLESSLYVLLERSA